jgi:hypothetical protein
MFCDNCKKERLEKDFINNQKFCYRCEYRKKKEKTTEKRIKKDLVCRQCQQVFYRNKEKGGSKRTVFCSMECAEKGHKESIKRHWTKRIQLTRIM